MAAASSLGAAASTGPRSACQGAWRSWPQRPAHGQGTVCCVSRAGGTEAQMARGVLAGFSGRPPACSRGGEMLLEARLKGPE